MVLGSIYGISANGSSKIYIGSTIQALKTRLSSHVSYYNAGTKGNGKKSTNSWDIFKEYGVNNCSIFLIEEVEVPTVEELRRIEGNYIKSTPGCVNRCIPGRTTKEYYNDNKELINRRTRIYHGKHRDTINKRSSTPMNCRLCGDRTTYSHLRRHQQTKKCSNKILN